MDKEIIVRLHSSFEDMVCKHAESGVEYWCARDLQMLLGYAQWRSFAAVIDKLAQAAATTRGTILPTSGKWSTLVRGLSGKSRTSR